MVRQAHHERELDGLTTNGICLPRSVLVGATCTDGGVGDRSVLASLGYARSQTAAPVGISG